MNEIRERLSNDLKDAMRAKDKDKLSIIRMIQSEIKQREIDNRDLVVDNQVIVDILSGMVKSRKQSIKQYELAERPELVAAEAGEIVIIEGYLPEKMSDHDLLVIIKDAANELNASTVRDISRLVQHVREKIGGQAETSHLNLLIKQYLTK